MKGKKHLTKIKKWNVLLIILNHIMQNILKYYVEADIINIELSSIKILEYDNYYYSHTRYNKYQNDLEK